MGIKQGRILNKFDTSGIKTVRVEVMGEDEYYTSKEVSEPDTEDALHYIESLIFQGSEKQIKWAKDIALKNIEDVARALKLDKSIPASAKWWIDNRNNLIF